jgi:hypothetical protein
MKAARWQERRPEETEGRLKEDDEGNLGSTSVPIAFFRWENGFWYIKTTAICFSSDTGSRFFALPYYHTAFSRFTKCVCIMGIYFAHCGVAYRSSLLDKLDILVDKW